MKVIIGHDPILNSTIQDVALDMQKLKVNICPELLLELERNNFSFDIK
jgi:hypothetical protein